MSQQVRTVLFDLDGTLADTAPDLAFALNCLRQEEDVPEMPYSVIRPHVSHGATALVKLGFPHISDSTAFERLRARFLKLYEDNLARHTRLFPGMPLVLDTLEQHRMNWGVVTNKPAWLTEPLLTKLELKSRAACIVSGDTTERKKPHPEPVLLGCNLAGSQAHECVYVGDAERDIVAGNEAGLHTLVALFGYLGENDHPADWGADALIESPLDILAWIENLNANPSPQH